MSAALKFKYFPTRFVLILTASHLYTTPNISALLEQSQRGKRGIERYA